MNALKVGMEMSKFDSRADTPKLIAALEGLEMKEGDDFPQGDKTLRKADHQAFLREFLFEVNNRDYKLLATIRKKTRPSFRRPARSLHKCAPSLRLTYAPRRRAGERRRRLS